MKTVSIVICLLIMTLSCGFPLEVEPTPRPTYTRYPTYTPYSNTSAAPNKVHEVGAEEWFIGEALVAVEKGKEMFRIGLYENAVIAFKEAQSHHGEPSSVLENWIALSYDALENYDLAIQHHSYAIALGDDAINRANRGASYLNNLQCEPAMVDAEAALTMAPKSTDGYHTDAEANTILATCYYLQDDLLPALQHADAALALARGSNYTEADVAAIEELRALIRLEINP